MGGGSHGNYEAVILEGDRLQHWYRDNADNFSWKRAQPIVAAGAGDAGAIIQSSRGHRNFEVLVPCHENGIVVLRHYFRDNADPSTLWVRAPNVTESNRRVVGAASMIESDFTRNDVPNFEVVVPVIGDDGNVELRHYFRYNDDLGSAWVRTPHRINVDGNIVLGAASLIQSSFHRGDNGNFEVAAWVQLPDGRKVIQHYWRYNDDVNAPWQPGQVIAERARGPAIIIQGDLGYGTHRNFEVVAPVDGPGGGTQLQHFFHENDDVTKEWRRGRVISEVVTDGGCGCIMQCSYPGGTHHNLEVIVEECASEVMQYWRSSEFWTTFWVRGANVIGAPPPAREIRNTHRMMQVTGEYDRSLPEPLTNNAMAYERLAYNRTVNYGGIDGAAAGIEGTDLGSSFEHKGKVYFLFGDTRRVGEGPPYPDLDSIAYSTQAKLHLVLNLEFLPSYPKCAGILQGGLEVPVEGFSHGGLMYVFFSTDTFKVWAYTADEIKLMGRTVLAVSNDDGREFVPLVTWSTDKFINMSVELEDLSRQHAALLSWQAGIRVAWIWGSGRYRGSPPYLAVVDLERLLTKLRDNGERDRAVLSDLLPDDSPVRYFAGDAEHPRWSSREYEAAPLFCASDIGEICARWNAQLARYLLTFNSANPRGILLRGSKHPWGPWSSTARLFDPGWDTGQGSYLRAGYGRFMHIPWNKGGVDHCFDDLMPYSRENEYGGEYGPYLIKPYFDGDGGKAKIYWLMSTWNPYQVVLMESDLTVDDVGG
jgi:hypothetical protein